MKTEEDLEFLESPENLGFGTLKPTFQKWFPDWKQDFCTQAASAATGIWVMHVRLVGWHAAKAEVWRRIAVPSDYTLFDLSYLVLDAFKFDNDHLHEFCYRDDRRKERVYSHPDCEEPPFSDEITLAETRLPVKGVMKFHFDFGDDWEFSIKLEKIAPTEAFPQAPNLVESFGKAPKQYPNDYL